MSAGQPNRLESGGRIDRTRRLRFRFDGRACEGFQGDSLASALLANDIHLVGRGFKYHRPRGILGIGAEEPNALLRIGTGNRGEPNQKATQVELVDGLVAHSQNRWPNLRWDLGAVNDRLHRLLPAGFYYKTFMWPESWWLRYERLIRRAAGLGTAPEGRDPDRYEARYAHCDVLVAGGGPAGLAAALAAGRTGARVILADEQAEFGGALLGEDAAMDGAPALDWVAETLAALEAMPEVTLLRRATVTGYYDHNFLTVAERVSDHLAEPPPHLPRQRLWKVRAGQVVLATGAIERPLVFADNDRPGVMLSSAVRAYAHRYAVRAGRRVLVFTGNDDGYRTALAMLAAGAAVPAVADLRAAPQGPLVDAVRERGVRVLEGHAVTGTGGRLRLRSADLRRMDGSASTVFGAATRIECDVIAMAGGWNPNVQLFSQSRGRLRWDPGLSGFVPGESAQAERSAGACNGAMRLADCLEQGVKAGIAAARAAGFEGDAPSMPAVQEEDWSAGRTVWTVPSVRRVGRGGKHFVDFQNDVTAADVQLAMREGYRSVEHLKRYTTTGMGTDQGRTSNINALAIAGEMLGADIPAMGTTSSRPPASPTTIGLYAGRDIGALFDPVRRTAMDPWHRANGARFEHVGQWMRAWYYPRQGESFRQAVDREVKAARAGLGILDASTLGKIDIQGPDAADFLNRIYTNAWSRLAVGSCRYGLMLGEDGMVMDDGVTARLGEHHFHMTTTTGGAGHVLDWLEEWLRTEWPELRVHVQSVTEQWAVAAICGPDARALLGELCEDVDLSDAAFPFMAVREGTVAGVPARLFRISFTGELSYEINVPRRWGLALWERLMAAGARHGIIPYGTEAMHVLRAEKGFIIVGQETDGSVTPDDLGMGWILSRSKPDFIGKRSLARADMQRPDRKQLVGLLTENPEEVLPEGGQIVAELKDAPPMVMLGHVTSSYYSPNLGRSIALALVRGGRGRIGETLSVPLADKIVRVVVTEPRFFDPEGKRLNGNG